MPRRRSWFTPLVVLATACSLDGLTSDLQPETGAGAVYSLIQVNGLNVPAQIRQGQTQLEVTRGALTLAPDSSWILSYILRARNGGADQVSTQTSRGRYSVAGNAIALRLTNDTTARYRGSYSATDVDVMDQGAANGDRFVFRR